MSQKTQLEKFKRKDKANIGDRYLPDHTLSDVDFKDIEVVDKNIRDEQSYIDHPETLELAHNILENGMQNPVRVYRKDGRVGNNFILLDGYRRYHAIKMIMDNETLQATGGYEPVRITDELRRRVSQVPCVIGKKLQDDELIITRALLNDKRKPLDNLEWADVVTSLINIDSKKNTQTNIAKKLGYARQQINDWVAIYRIDGEIKRLIKEIQRYGQSLDSLSTTVDRDNLSTTVDNDNKYSVIGRNILRDIAVSDNQSLAFWKKFGKLCTGKDAKALGLDVDSIKKMEKKDKERTEYEQRVVNYLKYRDKILNKISKKEGLERDLYEQNLRSIERMLVIEIVGFHGFNYDEIFNPDTKESIKDLISPSTVQYSTDTNTTTTELKFDFEYTEYDFTFTVKKYGLGKTLYAIIDLIFYYRENKKRIGDLLSFVRNNVSDDKRMRFIPSFLNRPDAEIDEGYIKYVRDGCPDILQIVDHTNTDIKLEERPFLPSHEKKYGFGILRNLLKLYLEKRKG